MEPSPRVGSVVPGVVLGWGRTAPAGCLLDFPVPASKHETFWIMQDSICLLNEQPSSFASKAWPCKPPFCICYFQGLHRLEDHILGPAEVPQTLRLLCGGQD